MTKISAVVPDELGAATESRRWIARGLELIESRCRRLGSFGSREGAEFVPLELDLAAIGDALDAVFLAFSRFIRSARRKEPSNPVSETHNRHLRRL